jgi:hypothetical protein
LLNSDGLQAIRDFLHLVPHRNRDNGMTVANTGTGPAAPRPIPFFRCDDRNRIRDAAEPHLPAPPLYLESMLNMRSLRSDPPQHNSQYQNASR